MRRLDKFVLSATPSVGVQFREQPYDRSSEAELLRDILAIANANLDGLRLIVTGIRFDAEGRREFVGIGPGASISMAGHKELIRDYIEPPIRLEHTTFKVDGATVGIYKVQDCQDRPYMMRINHSDTLQRGDAWVRNGNRRLRLGRSQLQTIFAAKFQDSVSADKIEVGFGTDIIEKEMTVPTIDLSGLPSRKAANEVLSLINARRGSQNSGMTTRMERLMHMRVRGADVPFEPRSTFTLEEEILEIPHRHHDLDLNFLFNTNGVDLPLVVLNHGDEELKGASIIFELPIISGFQLATELPDALPSDNPFRGSNIMGLGYPSVQIKDATARISQTLGDIPAGAIASVSSSAVRVACGSEAAGRRVAISYTLSAQNLRVPAQGKLKLWLAGGREKTAATG